jgi:hypothetical protein
MPGSRQACQSILSRPKNRSRGSCRSRIHVPAPAVGSCRLLLLLVSPDPHPVNLHLLRKYSCAVGTADEVSANRDVEKDEERALKLGGTVYSSRDVCLGILHAINVPLD